jgi:hypothetical protein
MSELKLRPPKDGALRGGPGRDAQNAEGRGYKLQGRTRPCWTKVRRLHTSTAGEEGLSAARRWIETAAPSRTFGMTYGRESQDKLAR